MLHYKLQLTQAIHFRALLNQNLRIRHLREFTIVYTFLRVSDVPDYNFEVSKKIHSWMKGKGKGGEGREGRGGEGRGERGEGRGERGEGRGERGEGRGERGEGRGERGEGRGEGEREGRGEEEGRERTRRIRLRIPTAKMTLNAGIKMNIRTPCVNFAITDTYASNPAIPHDAKVPARNRFAPALAEG